MPQGEHIIERKITMRGKKTLHRQKKTQQASGKKSMYPKHFKRFVQVRAWSDILTDQTISIYKSLV